MKYASAQLISDNLCTFEQYNIGDKVMITGDEPDFYGQKVQFGIISSFGYDSEGAMTINVDIVGMREIRPYNPRKSCFNIKVI